VRIEAEGGRPVTARPHEGRLDGTLFDVTLPPGEGVLVVRAAGTPARSQRVRYVPSHASPLVEEARALRARGAQDEAARKLRDGLDAEALEDRAIAEGLLARTELSLDHPDAAIALFARSIAGHRAHGLLSEEASDSFALAHALTDERRFSEARAALAAAQPAWSAYPEGAVRARYYGAVLARQSGDVVGAADALRTVREDAKRLGMDTIARSARTSYSLSVWELGRAREATAELRAILDLDAASLSPCERAQLLANLGWDLLRAREEADAAPDVSGDPRPPLEEAKALFTGACPEPRSASDAWGHLAVEALERGDPRAAEKALAHAKAAVPAPDPLAALEWLEIEARVALLDHRASEAATLFARQARAARAAVWVSAEWRALVGQGEALEAVGQRAAAKAAYEGAEALIQEQASWVPLVDGRDAFFGGRSRSARALVDLLLRMDAPEEAARVARAAAGRALAALEQHDRVAQLRGPAREAWDEGIGAYQRAREALEREAADDWKLAPPSLEAARAHRKEREEAIRAALGKAFAALDAGAPEGRRPAAARPPPGALVLRYFPIRDGWAGFAIAAEGVTARALGAVDTAAPKAVLAERLLAPFRAEIARAERLSFVPYGALRDVDFHALPWEGGPLVAHAPVDYPLDRFERTADAPSDAPRRALVVGDPSGNLPAAEREARAVRDALAGGAWSVRALVGRDADRSTVTRAIASADLLHFAGHGVFGTGSGWDSALVLAEGARMTAGDILALPKVPELVVLSGCETARSAHDAAPEGLGLANAFVIDGAREVIASTRVLDDATAPALIGALYAALAAHGWQDAPAALRSAVLDVQPRFPDADWSAFRAIVP
jgi:hypothetical protein